jgi:hypothetical protein
MEPNQTNKSNQINSMTIINNTCSTESLLLFANKRRTKTQNSNKEMITLGKKNSGC